MRKLSSSVALFPRPCSSDGWLKSSPDSGCGVGRSEKSAESDYLFDLRCCGLVVDASRQGNLTRFINHAPHPTANAVAALGLVGGVRKVGVRAARAVLEGEEVLLDYGRTWWRS